MTKDQLLFYTEIKKEYEFHFNGKTYVLFYGDAHNGKNTLKFGRLYDEPEEYKNFNDLMNHAKVENHFLREILETLD